MSPVPRFGRRAPGALAVVLVAVLAGCGSGAGGGWTDDGDEAGYVSGDRSVTTWDGDERTGPVEIVGVDFAGAAVDVAAWQGDVVVLNTWYAACPPCRAEAPDLAEIADEYADQGVHLLGINSTDEPGAAQAFERTFELPYPSVHDVDGAAVAALQGIVPVAAVPTTVLLDRQGDVAARILGLADPSTLRTLIDDLLDEPA
ncbi:TlpA disulfide reductase family protein [Cellulomonas sp. KRMCY2]|uniref:TlpA family protein disulfide reductase n=1 Tax=Cellulomonas sp. KRMCY2 TaxID=1304865 RepID=UPI00045EC2DC|nr:TlpA disulfide reductase family protein [Cellulomonas sp. KRMCY2]